MVGKKLIWLFILGIGLLTQAQTTETKGVLLELFTSQGCSSCPPADQLLEEIKESYSDQHVYTISYHVDYWNRLGWKDPFSKKEYSDYQRAYASQFNSRSIYTPQLVINGNEHFTGSDRFKALDAIEHYLLSSEFVSFKSWEVLLQDDTIYVQYALESDQNLEVITVITLDQKTTKVLRGENGDRTLTNTNIVLDKQAKQHKEGIFNFQLPENIEKADRLKILTYIKNEDGMVIGVRQDKLPY